MSEKRYIITGLDEGIEIMPFVVYQSDLNLIFDNAYGDKHRDYVPYTKELYDELLREYKRNGGNK